MFPKLKIILSFFYIKSIIYFLLFFIPQVNAETKIIAKDGDTLFKLSKRYGIPLKELMHKNNLNDANQILGGKVLIVPMKGNINNTNESLTYKVIEGDTLFKIARDHNVTVKEIVSINNLYNSSVLRPNQIILLPNDAIYKRVINKKNTEYINTKTTYHQTSFSQDLTEIASMHKVSTEDIIVLNGLKDTKKIKPYTKLKVRKNESLKWLKYGTVIVNWSEWTYQEGNYITQAKNKKNKSFYLALNCKKRILNNTLKNSYWTNWYFPESDFEFKLINDFCGKGL